MCLELLAMNDRKQLLKLQKEMEAEREALGAEVQQLSERLEQEAVSSPKRRAKEAEEQLDELKAASDEAAMRAEAMEGAAGMQSTANATAWRGAWLDAETPRNCRREAL